MASQEIILKVFVSSPGDVQDERVAIAEIVEEINRAWASFLGIRLEGIRWETHCRPGIGTDSQQVINEQIPKDYDIYLGILWKRFGTPTERFGSGTDEEFEDACQRNRKNPKEVSIMFYFKDVPVAPSEIEPDQLRKVNGFREKLKAKGVLFWRFDSIGEFRQLIRLHLSAELQKRHESSTTCPEPNPRETEAIEIDLKSLESNSAGQSEEIVSLAVKALESLNRYELGLGKVTGNSPEEMLANLIQATESYCDDVEKLANGFVTKIEIATKVWVDFFMAELLTGEIAKGKSKQFLKNFRRMAEVFEEQARRYCEPLEMDDELSVIPEFCVSERRMDRVHLMFARELERAAQILREAERIADALSAKRRTNIS